MTDSEAQNSKSTGEPQAPNHFTVKLTSLDGANEVVAEFQENEEDAAHPPKLIKLTTNSLSSPKPASTPRETHIILSIGSGHRKAEIFFKEVVAPILDHAGIKDSRVHTTRSETSVLELTRDTFLPAAIDGKPIRIILASGDGGIVDLVNGLLAQPHSETYVPPEVVLLPLGTANALYHSINSASNGSNTWGLEALSSTTSKPLPTFTATFSPGSRLLIDEARKEEKLNNANQVHGAVVLSWGMHASLVADSDTTEYRKFGIDRFKMAAKEALYPADGSLPHPYRGKVSYLTQDGKWTKLDGEEHLYTLATLVSNLEAPFCISPATKPLDGSMHLVHFGPTSGDEAMRIMGLAYQGGKHVDDGMVQYEQIEGLKIEFDEEDGKWRRVCVDGKIIRVEKGGWVEARKRVGGVLDVVTAE
jgi:diacylglycerol kinase family enzyme